MERIDLDIDWQEKVDTDYCVTELLRYVDDPFNKMERAISVNARQYANPESPYFMKSPEEIVKIWTDKQLRSQEIGKALDAYTGLVEEPDRMRDHYDTTWESWNDLYNNDETIMTICNGWKTFWEGLEKLGYKMVKREQHFHKEWNGKSVRGRTDMILYYPPKDALLLIDWKTSEVMNVARKRRFGLHGPDWCSGLAQEKLTHYGLQVNTYRTMLQDCCNKPYTIHEAVIQIARDGKANVYREPVLYNRHQMDELIEWCINENIKDPDRFKDA